MKHARRQASPSCARRSATRSFSDDLRRRDAHILRVRLRGLEGDGLVRSVFLERNGVVLAGDRTDTEPQLLLLHAGRERRSVWHPIMRNLAAVGVGTVAYDQRGHGQSGGSREDSIVEFGDDATAMVDGLARPVVVGASLGGLAALLALSRPTMKGKTAGLVLVDVLPDPDPVDVRALLGLHRGQNAFVERILSSADQFRAAAARLEMPILLVRAGRENAVDDKGVERLASLVPHLQVAAVPEAGHLIARDAPDALSSLLHAFAQSDEVRHRRSSMA